MIEYRMALPADTDQLVDLRIDFLNEISGRQPAETEENLRLSLEGYFDKALADGSYLCILALDGKNVAGVAGMAIWTKPGNYKCPGGRVGYVMNMYTPPEYRKRGICSELLRRLTGTARELGIGILEMHATTEGEPLYRKQLFTEPQSPVLELKL